MGRERAGGGGRSRLDLDGNEKALAGPEELIGPTAEPVPGRAQEPGWRRGLPIRGEDPAAPPGTAGPAEAVEGEEDQGEEDKPDHELPVERERRDRKAQRKVHQNHTPNRRSPTTAATALRQGVSD